MGTNEHGLYSTGSGRYFRYRWTGGLSCYSTPNNFQVADLVNGKILEIQL
jgi:hypothetical protein